jgi:hypothetical protein
MFMCLAALAAASQAHYSWQHTRLFEQAVAALPEEQQDDLARMLLQLAGVEQPPYLLTPEEEADLDASIAEAERGDFASDDEVRTIWAKHGL